MDTFINSVEVRSNHIGFIVSINADFVITVNACNIISSNES